MGRGGAVHRCGRGAGSTRPHRRPPRMPRYNAVELRRQTMARPITLFTGQWADLPFEEMCRLASEWGYDGLEIACWGDHFEVDKALADESYVERKRETLAKYNLGVWAISNH